MGAAAVRRPTLQACQTTRKRGVFGPVATGGHTRIYIMTTVGVCRVWDGASFADVPDVGAAGALDEVVEAAGAAEEECGDAAVVLRGVVLHQDADQVVVSCGGLLARVPRRPEHALQSAVRVLVRQRSHAA